MNAITVRQLGKKFKLFGSPGKRVLEYLSLGKLSRHTDFWALQDITFEIPAGTTLGILGQNGSGKSTLLSILAGVLEPSAGFFEINGKVSAILELGSGFHPEFSGRDNVYMYGSIMGLSKQEIDERFDEIVRFSELGDFIDQPLRTYSTGMVVRLAFSVAVNVDADILIVDEALAVGDAIFQHRCTRKIRELQAAGKTILYVGHNIDALRSICTQALLLDGGRIIERGDPNHVINKYFELIADRERAYKEGTLIEHGEMIAENSTTVYNFTQNLNQAEIISHPMIPVCERTIDVNSIPRKIIFAHPPSQLTYSLMIEPRSLIAFAIGIMPEVWDKIPQGVKFDIDIFSDGQRENIFSRVLQPKRNIGDRGWHNFLISLEKYSGKKASMIFRTSGSSDDLSYGWSAWGWMRIIQQPEVSQPDSQEVMNEDKIHLNTEIPELTNSDVRIGSKKAIITKVEILDIDGKEKLTFNSGDIAIFKIHIFFNQNIEKDFTVGCTVKGKYTEIYGTSTRMEGIDLGSREKGESITVSFAQIVNLASGIYSVTTGCTITHSDTEIEVLDRYYDCAFFRVDLNKRMVGVVNLNAKVTIGNE
ncbi:MAG: ABC transporter ATP-binding protein [Methanoregula sp.]|nr:ABC transporter ATP-binding protein [Methanoregula sp.]